MEICPTCKRKIAPPRGGDVPRKKLAQDKERCLNAIGICLRAQDRWDLSEAVKMSAMDESIRLRRALDDHRLLKSIYRRADKGVCYA